MKIYLSSPFFNEQEITVMRKASEILKGRGYDVYIPMDCQTDKTKIDDTIWAKNTFNLDKTAIDNCDLVVLLYWGMYSDSGTAWESGYAFAKNIPVIVVHCQSTDKNNLMIINGAHTNLPDLEALKTYDFINLPQSGFFSHNTILIKNLRLKFYNLNLK